MLSEFYQFVIPDDIKEKIDICLSKRSWTLNKSMSPYGTTIFQIVIDNFDTVTKFELAQMLGCCGICVSTDAYVYPKYRQRGLGKILNLLRIQIAKNLGYGLLLCTDIENNPAQRKILQQNGWKDIHDFVNPKTGNKVLISVIGL